MMETVRSEAVRSAHRAAFRGVTALVVGYLGLSVAALVVAVVLRDRPGLVNDVVWVRGTLVVVSAALTLLFTVRAARGSRRDYLRLRIVSGVMVVAIAVLIAIPGFLPGWMRVEQAACGVLLLGVVAMVNAPRTRALFRGQG